MQNIAKSAVAARAARLNQPEMVQAYSDMAISETATHYELVEDDWRGLNTRWRENGQSGGGGGRGAGPPQTKGSRRRGGPPQTKGSRRRGGPPQTKGSRRRGGPPSTGAAPAAPCSGGSHLLKSPLWTEFVAAAAEVERELIAGIEKSNMTVCQKKARLRRLLDDYRERKKPGK